MMNNLLNSAYKREEWIEFLQSRFLPNDFKLRRQAINIDFKSKYIKPQAYWIGDCNSLDDLAVIEISHASEHDPRIGVSRDAFRLMAELNLSKALFFFVSDNSQNYRFSLITLELKLEGMDVQYNFSNPKRFSFYLGENAKTKTPESFLVKRDRILDFKDLQSRFSVEVVNKEFYKEIQKMFYHLVGGKINRGNKVLEYEPMLILPDEVAKTRQEFGVRLIGRLVFCWFLKKKLSDKGNPLISEEVLSLAAVSDSYYHQVLEPLFFEVLNTPLQQRQSQYRNTLYDGIPFLNGGLFDPSLHQDFYISSSAHQMAQTTWSLKIPDKWFRDFFAILETYNFTIDENTSIDIDLSVDPEMLGRIFENLLAELNPETGETARKSTGSFYTPRPIVDYMVDESLLHYLKSKTDISETELRALLDFNIEESELSKIQKIAIIDALDEIKVLDPTCGSGAFPIGILQKMLLILQKVDPESIEWVIRQLSKIPNKLVRKALEDKLMSENWRYKHKMGIIQNAIYGVDIQPIATEISKLRLFLSLIVDETVIEAEENKNIHPLPNLSFKFVTANSLISLGEKEETKTRYLNIIKGFDDIRERYLHAHSTTEKEQIRQDYAKLNKSLMDTLTDNQYKQSSFLDETQAEMDFSPDKDSYLYKLLAWDPFSDKASQWFDPKWMFGIKTGFDIIIGNPPWVQAAGIPLHEKEYYKKHYSLSKGQFDLFCLFVEKAISLLSTQSVMLFITPNRFITNIDYTAFRYFLLRSSSIKQVIDLGDGIFTDVRMPSAILVCTNEDSITNSLLFSLGFEDIFKQKKQADILDVENYIFPLYSDELYTPLLEKINANSLQLKELMDNARGVEIGKASRAITTNRESGCVPLLRGEDIDRYRIREQVYLRTSVSGINYKSPNLYKGEKILIRKTGDGITATIDSDFRYVLQVVYIFKLKTGIISNYRFVLAILNSSLMDFWYHNTFGEKGRKTFPHLTQGKVKKFPIHKHYQCKKDIFNHLIDQAIACESPNHRHGISTQIDLMVYKLYELTYSEVKLIDPDFDSILASFGLSTQDYERMSVLELSELKVR
jgi:hypothetical protein